MSRIVLQGPAGAYLAGIYTSTTIPHGLGEKAIADNGHYVFAQADGAIAAGAYCRWLPETGQMDSETTAESGSTPVAGAVAVVALADDEYGWFWRGCGYEEALVATGVSALAALTTTATAGELGAGGDSVVGAQLVDANSSGATALRTIQAYGFLGTN